MQCCYKNGVYFSLPQAGHVLGSEVMECLSWRRGALFYMYCHTLFNDPQRMQQNRAHLMQVLFKHSVTFNVKHRFDIHVACSSWV